MSTKIEVEPSEAGGPDAAELGVVIVSYNTRELLRACLEHLLPAIENAGLSSEVWVVDNDSSDDSVAMVARDFPTVQRMAEDCNLGFTAANNRLLGPWAQSAGSCPRWVLLLNPDAELEPPAIGELIAALEADPQAAVAGPALHYADGSFQHAAFRYPGLRQTALDLFPIARLQDHPVNGRYPRERYDSGEPFAVDFVLGACMLVRGEALRQVGPLDEGFFMYCEEIDWCRRFERSGWRSLCVPRARALHHGGASTGQASFRSAAFINLWRSRRRWFAIHAPNWRRTGVELLLRFGLIRRVVADWWAARRGRLAFEDFAARMVAYRVVLRPLAPDVDDLRKRGR